jgi:hypothetical protein
MKITTTATTTKASIKVNAASASREERVFMAKAAYAARGWKECSFGRTPSDEAWAGTELSVLRLWLSNGNA